MLRRKKGKIVSFTISSGSASNEAAKLAAIPFVGELTRNVDVWLKKIGDTSSRERKGSIERPTESNVNSHIVSVEELDNGQYYLSKIKMGDYVVEYSQPTGDDVATKVKTISDEVPQVRFPEVEIATFLRNEPKEITITAVPATFGTNGVVRVDGRVLSSAEVIREGTGIKIRLAPGEREVVLIGTGFGKRKRIAVTDRASVAFSTFEDTNVTETTETETEESEGDLDPNGGRIRVINVPEDGKVYARKGSANTEINIDDGSGISRRIEAGRWEVRVEVDGMRQNGLDRSVTVLAGEDIEINFANTPDPNVRLRITNVPEGATISARGPGDITREITATAGTTLVSDLSPGVWTVTIVSGSNRVEKQVTISSTQTVEISAAGESGTIEVKKNDLINYGIGGAALLLLGYLALSGDEKKKKNIYEE